MTGRERENCRSGCLLFQSAAGSAFKRCRTVRKRPYMVCFLEGYLDEQVITFIRAALYIGGGPFLYAKDTGKPVPN